jgi:hypothetical protein
VLLPLCCLFTVSVVNGIAGYTRHCLSPKTYVIGPSGRSGVLLQNIGEEYFFIICIVIIFIKTNL